MYDIIIGIDNGVSGTIGIIDLRDNTSKFILTPTKSELSYTKTKKNISRVDVNKLREILNPYKGTNVHILVERPMVNPGRFDATISAIRALEATLIIIEELNMSHEYVDSKGWQKQLLPVGIKGSAELKSASVTIGNRLFPSHSELINKHKDADGILIAEYGRRLFHKN